MNMLIFTLEGGKQLQVFEHVLSIFDEYKP